MTADIATRFAQETAEHRMTVLHDDGLYRHLHFQQPKHSFYWFDLITVPGSLIFRGDGTSYVFARLPDMFEFFRGQRINPGFEAQITAATVEAIRDRSAPLGLGLAVRVDLLDSDEAWTDEGAHRILRDFEYYRGPGDGFAFSDTWEWDFRDYDWWFLWSLHAIVWGIAQYDARTPQAPEPAVAGGVL